MIISKLWDTAWDLRRYRNGIVHAKEISMVKEKLLSEVAEELQKGIEFLPLNNQHWVGYTLNELAKKPAVGYLQGCLALNC